MANWVDGYAILRGTIDDILAFITTCTIHQSNPVQATIEGSKITFPNNFIPEDLYVFNSTRAFIGFCHKHDIKKTDTVDLYEVSVTWNQAHGLITEELSAFAKQNNLAIEVEGIVVELALKEHIIVNRRGEILLDECIEYHGDDYNPYDEEINDTTI